MMISREVYSMNYDAVATMDQRAGRCEMDSHADTCVAGANCTVLEYTGRFATVEAAMVAATVVAEEAAAGGGRAPSWRGNRRGCDPPQPAAAEAAEDSHCPAAPGVPLRRGPAQRGVLSLRLITCEGQLWPAQVAAQLAENLH